MKIVNMKDMSDAVNNAIEHLDKEYGMANNWQQEERRWREEFDLRIERFGGDKIHFKNGSDHIMFLLRWT